MAQETIMMSDVLALLVFFGGGALILAFGATCYVALKRWSQRPLRLRRKAVEEMDALAGRVGELESETAQLPTLIERVEFLERLLEDTARAPALPRRAEPERQPWRAATEERDSRLLKNLACARARVRAPM